LLSNPVPSNSFLLLLTQSAELIQEKIALMMAEAQGKNDAEAEARLTEMRRKNTKKAMVSLMATPEDAAIAEIMFDQMTDAERDRVSHHHLPPLPFCPLPLDSYLPSVS